MKRALTSDAWSPHFGGMERTPQESFRPWLKPFSTVEWWRHIRWTCGPLSLPRWNLYIWLQQRLGTAPTTIWLSGVRLIVWDDYIGVSCQITWFNAATPLTGQSYWKSANKHWGLSGDHFGVGPLSGWPTHIFLEAMHSRIPQQSKFAQV